MCIAALIILLAAPVSAQPPINRPRQPAVRPLPAPNVLPFGFAGSQPLGPGQGLRSILATVKGRRVQIEDRYGTRIEMSITRKMDGEERTEKFSAADVAALRTQNADAAALYQKITGTN